MARAPLGDVRVLGALLCAGGFALAWAPRLWQSALGLECVATAFWVWARHSERPGEQLPRWAWLRRPASALWLAAACSIALELGGSRSSALSSVSNPFGTLRWLQSVGLLWAALELLAALPLVRSFADLPGPLDLARPWIPSALPAAGFAVLWRHADAWTSSPVMREIAIALLVVTAWLGSLRAFSRRPWEPTLRWLIVTDCAIAALLVALRLVHPLASLLLWLAAWGGKAFLLASELSGRGSRRGPLLSRTWRISSLVTSTALAWPALLTFALAPGGGARWTHFVATAVPVAIAASVTTRRLVEVPERRQVMRPQSAVSLTHVTAIVLLALAPLALGIAWWGGFEASLQAVAIGVVPTTLGVLLGRPGPEMPGLRRARETARGLYRFFVDREQWLVALLWRTLRGLSAPLRDLHAGDAQEYLLFLIGVAVFALLLPVLQ